jgi:hypothetical protein
MCGSFLGTYLPLREKNPGAHTSVSLDTVARVANTFLERAARIKNEEFFPWDGDDVVGVCINLIDQVRLPPPPFPTLLLVDETGEGVLLNGWLTMGARGM